MTLEEAKKILKEEGYSLEGPGKPGVVSEYFKEYESPEVCEAMQVVCSAGYMMMMFGNVFEARKDRLRKEYEKNTKAPGSAENSIKGDLSGNESIEHCGEPIPGSPLSAVEGIKLKWKDNRNTSENPALKESASQFNDALLDEQAKKIAELTKDKELMKKATLSQLDDFIEIYNLLTKESQKTKRLGKEISKLNGIIHDKNEEIKRKTKGCCELVAENVDLKEGLRKTESLLQDVREANSRNLDTCFKNDDLIDELKKKLAEKTKLAKKYAKELSDSSLGLCKLEKQLEDKDAVLADVAEELRLTKIREKNLAELGLKYVGENEKLKKKLADKIVDEIDAQALKSAESTLAWKEKVIYYKDKVIADNEKEIADLSKELAESKKRVEWVRNASKEYCDYGVAANEFIKDLAGLYVLANNKGIINDEMLERCKNYQTYGFPANCNRETKKEINDIASGKENKKPRIPTPEEPKHGNSREDFIKKTIDSFNIRAANLGCVGSKDGNGILDQMVGVDIAEEGGDHSGVTVLCGKDFVKKFKENGWFDFSEKKYEEIVEELSKVTDETFDQFLQFGEIIIKSEK